MKLWKNYLRPAVTLMVICLLVGAALAAVNAATAPVIAANESASLNATYAAVLPEADGFEALDCSIEGVDRCAAGKKWRGLCHHRSEPGYGGRCPQRWPLLWMELSCGCRCCPMTRHRDWGRR